MKMKMKKDRIIGGGIIFLAAALFLFGWGTTNKAMAAEDITGPQVTAFSITPTSFNTETNEQILTLDITITDNISGFNWGTVRIAPHCESGFCMGAQYKDFAPGEYNRIGGDDKNGNYQMTVTLPAGSKMGAWDFSFANLSDKVGNWSYLDQTKLLAQVPDATVALTNTATVDDSVPPQVTAFSITPTSFNTETESQVLTLDITITDNISGFNWGTVRIAPHCESSFCPGDPYQDFSPGEYNRISGNDKNGNYQMTITMPVGSKIGVWDVSFVNLSDKVGNWAYLTPAMLLGQVSDATITLTNTAAASSDVAPPQVTAFSITPTSFNTESSSQTLTATATITDDFSGVQDFGGVMVRIRPLISTQYRDIYLYRHSGNNKNGEYSGTIYLEQYSKQGVWQVDFLNLRDNLGNMDQINADELSSVPGSSGITFTNTASASEVLIEKEWTISNNGNSVTFPAGTTVTKSDDGSFAFYQLTSQGYDISELPQDNLAGEVAGEIRLGIPGLNLEFSNPVSFALNVGSQYDGKTLEIKSLGETEDAWTNEGSCLVEEGICSFTANHATYFAAVMAEDVTVVPTNKEQCKKDGWKIFNDPVFKNQGDCVSWLQSNPKAIGNKIK